MPAGHRGEHAGANASEPETEVLAGSIERVTFH